jgi:hypothetical protein
VASDRDELLDAIEVLTRSNRSHILRTKNGISCVSGFGPGSLLEQLRNAIAGGVGAHAGAADGAGRWPINAGALSLNAEVQDEVRQWHVRDVHLPPAVTIEATLMAWHLAILNRRRRDGDTEQIERYAVRKLVGWANRIESMFDPVDRLELTQEVAVPVVDPITREPVLRRDGTPRVRVRQEPAACPRCGERTAFDRDTGDQITALVVEYRRTVGEAALHGASGACRFCGTEWSGEREVRELRWMLDHPGEFLDQGYPDDADD